ncbi:MAG: rhomboid family intramembrane serine protease [Acidimicrobiia bacterium]|nr:rhomboid family intramembrane serine protease [Acidimicrobiia bacterium]
MEPTAPGRTIGQLILQVVGGFLAVMWLIEIVDTTILDSRLQTHGIEPRQIDGLEGVLFAPVLHGGWAHIISNSVPFLVLGGLVMTYGLRRWVSATAVIVVLGGTVTWLAARTGNHIGASILVFGYFGFLLGMAWFERSFKSIGIAAVVAVFYGGLIWGVVPTDSGVSWEGHLFGALAGVAASWLLAGRARRPTAA